MKRPNWLVRALWWFLCGAVALLLGGLIIRVLNPLPSLEGRSVSRALEPDADTPLRQAISPKASAHPGLTGVHPLIDGHSAFAARVHLVRAARRTLDLQYYIWHADFSGTLLFDEVRKAADRGVRVRLLLDDNTTAGLDPVLAAVDAHPNIELRLFNPFVVRSPRLLGYLTDFARLNRRMHNKALVADNQAAIIGGRNIGDEYFNASEGAAFADLDLLAIGPVVAEVSDSFDAYWASGSSYPAASILPSEIAAVSIEQSAAAARSTKAGERYVRAVAASDYAERLQSGSFAFIWAPTRMVVDDPAKGLGEVPREGLLWPQMTRLLGKPEREFLLVSGYFVPTRTGTEMFARLAQDGVQVTVVTNALTSTDVPIVHAGYAKWRKALLRAGVDLFEMHVPPARTQALIGGSGSGGSGTRVSGAGSALHAKTFAVDGRRMFVGSFNFDPRSRDLNTELGFVIESDELARTMAGHLARFLPENTYQLELADDDLRWRETRSDGDLVHDTEPGTTWRDRAIVAVLSLLPIEWLL